MLRRRAAPVVSRVSAALFGVLIAAGAALLVVPLIPEGDQFKVGDVAPQALVATHDAQYVSDVLTEEARAAAADAVDPVTIDIPNVRADQRDLLAETVAQVEEIRSREDLSAEEQLAELELLEGLAGFSDAGRSNLLALPDDSFATLVDLADRALNEILAEPLLADQVDRRIDLYLLLPETVPAFTNGESAIREILEQYLVANVAIDEEQTAVRREEARENVLPQVVSYTSGQVIVAEGRELDAATIEALTQTGVINEGYDYFDLGAGLLIAGALGAAFGVYLYQLQPFSSPPERRMLMSVVAVLGTLLAVRLALPPLLPDEDGRLYPFALPVATAAVLVTSISAPRFGAVVGAGVALFAGFIAATTPDLAGAEFSGSLEALEIVIVYAAGSLAGAAAIQRTERLSRFVVAGLAVSVATAAALLAFWFLDEQRANEGLGWVAAAAGMSGAGAAVLGLSAHVILSMLLGVTTRMQLMELAQAGHPIMSRLQDQAPGTYHHSMMVAALAERAAERIGADSLVVRAGAYYHDIGKSVQPTYYIENNIERGASPHDELSPAESARIIREHVTKGVELARKNRLPKIVRDFIPQHHGTRLVTYFYRQASRDGEEVDPADYQYAGPRPQLKEHAIVMLADSCEALVRASQPGSTDDMDELVNRVFAERLAEGQFDECDITMRELQEVAASFKSTLRAVYHPRIEYPEAQTDEASTIARVEPQPSSGGQ